MNARLSNSASRGGLGEHVEGFDAAQTTLPATAATGAPSTERPWGIRWLFPDADVPLLRLDTDRLLLGRGDDCDQRLPGRQTSRHHAEIVRHGRLLLLRDLGSTNGVRVNGLSTPEAPLGLDDVVRLGEWIGVVCAAQSPTAQGPFQTLSPGFFAGPVLSAALTLARKAAPSDLPVVVEGETGTGKERVAHALHAWSGRSGGLVAVNCAALPDSLAEAELFGYRAGAFTGAQRGSEGHFRAAQGGTILLDEVTELSLPIQAKLLRALESGEVTPLGESGPVACDARVVVATQQPLATAVAAGAFRPDLMARLDGLTVALPPLRARRVEIPFLFHCLLAEHAGGEGLVPPVDPAVVEALCTYDWSFNVRELDRLVRRLLVLYGHEQKITLEHLPGRVSRRGLSHEGGAVDANGASSSLDGHSGSAGWRVRDEARDETDLTSLRDALRHRGGHVSRAAAAIGISRQRAYRLMNHAAELDLERLRGSKEQP